MHDYNYMSAEGGKNRRKEHLIKIRNNENGGSAYAANTKNTFSFAGGNEKYTKNRENVH